MRGYLIEYNPRTGAVSIETFNSLREATLERLKRERCNENQDVELVTVASHSEEDLKRSHSRYFMNEMFVT
ncbi:hypothetical protein CFELI_10440 [Corynebacterium felinum]|uniref:Uncharacterized protein n=1 Tax=Corynebacterium felinum TaxID=131318 RepID=A0ABU2B4G6_9CORY|nr:hypothetical protein [Corynebacterium felinum]WJY95686.1 hypothetical protein CFELI_10440 [Corynebacterium felinum]